MSRSTKTCFALAAASLLAAACASNTPPADTGAASASSSATPAARTGSVTTKNQTGQRTTSQAGAQPTLKGVPGQRSVYYDFDRSDVKPEFRPAIEAHARYLRDNADARVVIEGNGDERGSREYNLALGQKRAEAVRQMMKLSGAADGQIEAVSFGEEKPKALGHDEASWAENRRSDVVYQRGK
ncbi:MAG TPA: peptidoglycan-associated lipoprotein Pal [Burkholderiales bacterium]|jgi:peptidoglycan-associated lipoprotein